MRLLTALSIATIGIAIACAGSAAAQDKYPAEIVPQMGHTGDVLSVAFSPDSRFALSGSSDNTLRLWEVATGKELRSFTGHMGFVTSVAFSPDGRSVLSGSWDKTLSLWEVATGKELRRFGGHAGRIQSVALSPNGRFALSGSCGAFSEKKGEAYKCIKGALKLWEVATGKELRTFSGHNNIVESVAFSPDGHFALSGSADTTLKLWSVASGKLLHNFIGHSAAINSVAFSPDGRFVLSGSCDANDEMSSCTKGSVKLWNVATGDEVRSFIGHAGYVFSVAFSPDGRFALSGDDRSVLPDDGKRLNSEMKLWDVATGKELRSFTGHTNTVRSVAFSPDGRFALSGSGDSTLKLWEMATGKELRSFSGHTNATNSAAFSSNGRYALFGDDTLHLWDVSTGTMLRSFRWHAGGCVTSLALSPDGRLAVSAGDEEGRVGASGCLGKSLKFWEVTKGKELRTLSGNTTEVSSAFFSLDGRFLLSGDFQTVNLWDASTGNELRTFGDPKDRWEKTLKFLGLRSVTRHTSFVYSVAFSPDGRFVLSGSGDNNKGELKLWDVATGRELRTFSGHTGSIRSVAFSPDGRFALSGSEDKTLKLWEVASGKELRSFRGHTESVNSVAFSPDGHFALSGSGQADEITATINFEGKDYHLSHNEDNMLKLWDAATGKELRSFSGHTSSVRSVAFSSDGRFALSGSWDGTARVWDAGTGQEIARMMATPDDEWLTITPPAAGGFFTGSHRDTGMLALVRGTQATTVGQVHQSLYNPDLVREALAGDPSGEVKRAAEVINLGKVLDSGPAPQVEITSHSVDSKSNTDLVTVAARIKDRGKGIGRIEWRVNGITVGVSNAPANAGPGYEIRQTLAFDPGENAIEVVAYNARNLLASLPAQTTIAYTGPANSVKPKLHILAIGIDAYAGRVPKLKLAVADAKAFAAELQKAGAGFYSEVRMRTALDAEATAGGLDRIVQEFAAGIAPRDTFVLFAAAHGYSDARGRFYLIPQDYPGGLAPETLSERAIGQERLQDWIANRIKAKKALILLDTCESGALVNGYAQSRVTAQVSEAALGRLHEATGRPVLTAAAAGKPALEADSLGHGVFTAALIDALYHGDTNGDGLIQLSELAAHVEDMVPKLSAKREGQGRAAAAMAGAMPGAQSAHFGSTGGDFTIVRRLP